MAETLQEYLIKIGYQISGSKKVDDSTKKIGKNVKQVGKEAAISTLKMMGYAVGITTVAGTLKKLAESSADFAYSMREAYFSSELAGSTIKKMRGFEFAGKQIGLSSDAMDGLATSLSRTMRQNPAIESMVRNFSGIKDGSLETTDAIIKIVGALRQMKNQRQAGAMAESWFGIDSDTYFLMSKHFDELVESKKKYAEEEKKMRHDSDESSASGLEYAKVLDLLGIKFKFLSDNISIKLLPVFKELAEILEKGIDLLNELAVNTEFSGNKLLSDLGWGYGKLSEGAKKIGIDLPDTPSILSPASANIKPANDGKKWDGLNAGQPNNTKVSGASDAISYFMGKGWTKEQAAGIVASLQTESGLSPNPKGSNDKGKAYGVAQWHAPRQQKFKELYGKDIRQSTLAEQYDFTDYELRHGAGGKQLANAKNARDSGSIVSRLFEAPADKYGEASRRGALAEKLAQAQPQGTGLDAVLGDINSSKLGNNQTNISPSINQTTNINVTGSGSDQAAKSIAKEQSRVNGDLVRNTKGMVR